MLANPNYGLLHRPHQLKHSPLEAATPRHLVVRQTNVLHILGDVFLNTPAAKSAGATAVTPVKRTPKAAMAAANRSVRFIECPPAKSCKACNDPRIQRICVRVPASPPLDHRFARGRHGEVSPAILSYSVIACPVGSVPRRGADETPYFAWTGRRRAAGVPLCDRSIRSEAPVDRKIPGRRG